MVDLVYTRYIYGCGPYRYMSKREGSRVHSIYLGKGVGGNVYTTHNNEGYGAIKNKTEKDLNISDMTNAIGEGKMSSQETNIIGMSGTFPIYDNYGEGVTVRAIKDDRDEEAYEITIPQRPKIFGYGKTKVEVRYKNTVIEYAQARAEMISTHKEKGRWE